MDATKLTKSGLSYIRGPEKSVQRNESGNFIERLKFFATTKPDDEAFVFLSVNSERQAILWKELYENSVKVAKALLDTGVQKGEVVAVCIRPCPEWLYMVFGAMLMRAYPVNMVFTYKDGSDVIAFMKRLGNCSFVALDPGEDDENWQIFNSLVDSMNTNGHVKSEKMPFLRYAVVHHPDKQVAGLMNLQTWYKESNLDVNLPDIDSDHTAFLFQTSGSTGIPKIIAQPFKALESWAGYYLCFVKKIHFNDRPFGWVGGFPFTVHLGFTRVTLSGFSTPPADKMTFLVEAIQKENCDSSLILPSMLKELLAFQQKFKHPKTILRNVLTGGQPLPSFIAQCVGTVCDKLFTGYGGTEFSCISHHVQEDPESYKDNLCGRPEPEVEVKIVNNQGKTVPCNEIGEILVRTPFVMNEVYGDPEKTQQLLREDGWFVTGDIGHINEDGQLFVDGRKANEIIRGGMNIVTEIMEMSLRQCPDIAEVVIVPVPHPVQYQEICACVILKENSKATEEDLKKACEAIYADKQRSFSYMPDYYMIFDRFPETSTGKTSKYELAKMAKIAFAKHE